MSKVDNLLAKARLLSNAERRELAHLLLEQSALESASEEDVCGVRGLVAWTASAEIEDWSSYYPESLRDPGSLER